MWIRYVDNGQYLSKHQQKMHKRNLQRIKQNIPKYQIHRLNDTDNKINI